MNTVFEILLALVLGIASSLLATKIWQKYKQAKKVSWAEVEKSVIALTKVIASAQYRPDVIIGLGRSGSISAAILAGNLGAVPLLSLSYKREFRNLSEGLEGKEKKLTALYDLDFEKLKGKKILLVACLNIAGITIKDASKYISSNTDKIDLKTAVLFEISSPAITTDFQGEKISPGREDIYYEKLPWMLTSNYVHTHRPNQ